MTTATSTRTCAGTATSCPPQKLNSHVFWPDRAIHTENAFGAAYDAGTHVLRECLLYTISGMLVDGSL